jgi:predicted XRE-type DNA-binding protein
MSTKWPSEDKIKEILKIAEKAEAARPLPKNADPIDKLKHRLCREILIFKETNQLSHDEIGHKLGVGKTEVSKIINYHIDRYTIDKLYRLTLKLMPNFEIAA